MNTITPELHAISVFIATLNSVKGWGLPTVFIAISFGPWVAMLIISYYNHCRFETVVRMYEKSISNNDEMKELMNGFREMAKDYKDVLIRSTQASLRVEKAIGTSAYCPVERERRKTSQGRATR